MSVTASPIYLCLYVHWLVWMLFTRWVWLHLQYTSACMFIDWFECFSQDDCDCISNIPLPVCSLTGLNAFHKMIVTASPIYLCLYVHWLVWMLFTRWLWLHLQYTSACMFIDWFECFSSTFWQVCTPYDPVKFNLICPKYNQIILICSYKPDQSFVKIHSIVLGPFFCVHQERNRWMNRQPEILKW